MTIKQDIPNGWVEAALSQCLIQCTNIPHKVIVTDWLWRNKHAEAIETVIIPADYKWRDGIIAAYHKRLCA